MPEVWIPASYTTCANVEKGKRTFLPEMSHEIWHDKLEVEDED